MVVKQFCSACHIEKSCQFYREAGWMCDECAADSGFCPGCRQPVAGSEPDDQSMAEFGLCAECVEEMRVELGEYDEEEDW